VLSSRFRIITHWVSQSTQRDISDVTDTKVWSSSQVSAEAVVNISNNLKSTASEKSQKGQIAPVLQYLLHFTCSASSCVCCLKLSCLSLFVTWVVFGVALCSGNLSPQFASQISNGWFNWVSTTSIMKRNSIFYRLIRVATATLLFGFFNTESFLSINICACFFCSIQHWIWNFNWGNWRHPDGCDMTNHRWDIYCWRFWPCCCTFLHWRSTFDQFVSRQWGLWSWHASSTESWTVVHPFDSCVGISQDVIVPGSRSGCCIIWVLHDCIRKIFNPVYCVVYGAVVMGAFVAGHARCVPSCHRHGVCFLLWHGVALGARN